MYQNIESKTRIFSPDQNISFCHHSLNLSSSWELFSISDKINPECVSTPPQHWYINNIKNYKQSPPMWPNPEITYFNSVFNSEKQVLIPIDTTSSAHFLNIGSYSIVIITDTVAINDKISKFLFEKIDIAILHVSSYEYTESIRKKFRPRLCISTAKTTGRVYPSNILFIKNETCTIELQINTNNNIRVLQIY